MSHRLNRRMPRPYHEAVTDTFGKFSNTDRQVTTQEKNGLGKYLEQTVTIYSNKYLKSETGFNLGDIKNILLYSRCLKVVGKETITAMRGN